MELSFEELKEIAQAGDANAQFCIGYSYFYGKDVEEDKKEACRWMDKAAEQGNADAQEFLGMCYCSPGNGVFSDGFVAIYWFEKAAEQGKSFAQYMLGKMLIRGVDYLKDVKRGLYWVQQAAAQGLEEAIDFLRRYGY